MNRLADYHIHTFFSGDSEAKTDEIVKSAIEKGLSSICITDHLDFDYIVDDVLFELDKDKYFEYFENLREEYRDLLDIRIGIETGLEPDKSKRQAGNEDDPSCPFGYRHYSYGRNRYQHVSVQGSHGYCGQEDATR